MSDPKNPRRGRKSALEMEAVRQRFVELVNRGKGKTTIARELGIGPMAFARLLAEVLLSGEIKTLAEDWLLPAKAFPSVIRRGPGVSVDTFFLVEVTSKGFALTIVDDPATA